MNIIKEPQCICLEHGNSELLFVAEEYEVRQCNLCGQVLVAGIDLDGVQAEYDESNYFIQRNSYLERWEELCGHFQNIIDKIKKFKTDGVFLDVGCSVGVLLDVANKSGFEVKGVEVSQWASKFARQKGFDVVTGDLLSAGYPDRSFDVVVLNHVLEHIFEPIAILNEVERIMKDDGLLVIGVPNFGCYLAQVQKAKWFSLMPDQHIWQFTHKTLINLLSSCRFYEVFFESKDNHKIKFSPFNMWHRAINIYAVITNNSESMLLFANKKKIREK